MSASRLRVSAFEIPTASPEADGTLAWDRTVLVTVEVTAGGATGFGYTYADVPTARFVQAHLAGIVLGAEAPVPAEVFGAMERAVRNVGRDGVAATAIAAVDMACWDWRARSLGLSLVDLLGPRRAAVEVYGSGGFTNYTLDVLTRQLAGWKEQGFRRVKMKIGRDPRTPERVAAARSAVGPDVALFVDANGAFSPREALATASAMVASDVAWFEEPVSSDDLEGLRFVRERAPASMAVAAGEYGYRSRYFDRMIHAHSVDVLQADATRCGVTGFLAAAGLCEAVGVPLSAHCAPAIHASLGCAAPNVIHLEYFFDHSRIEGMLFDGPPPIERGALRPDRGRPGTGITLKRADADRFAVFDHTTEGTR